jgi:lipopolysaccharide export system protein LptC
MLVGKPKMPAPEVARPEQITSGPSSISGLDRQNLPYRVMATEAYQDEKVPHQVHLVKPTGTFQRLEQQTYDVSAHSGIYDTDTQMLDLEGQVKITAKDRFDAVMERAAIAAREKTLESETPVVVSFGTGSTISANGLKITDDGNHILFFNGVVAKFRTTGNKGDAQP